jgi:8-oxo-dGTP pyrophosphatase MutT (NUDIX family)
MRKGFNFPGVTIVYFCHDGKGNFIMGRRSKNTRDEHGRWDIGAGGLEFGEKIENTLRREVEEEYGTDILVYEFLGFRELHRKHKGETTHWIALDFKVLVDSKKVKNNEPHKFDDVSWFTLETIPTKTHSQLSNFLRNYNEKLKV